MKNTLSSLAKAAGVLLLSFSSASLFAIPDPAWTSNPSYFNVNSLDPGATFDGNIDLPFYKIDLPATESGPGASLIDYTLSADENTILATWALGTLSFSSVALKQSTEYTIWDTSSVNWAGYSGFFVTNTQIDPAGISHVSMSGTNVPEGGSTVLLLGAALSVGAFIRRRRA